MRNHTSKHVAALCLTAVALVVLAGCSADSPTAPKTPTPATGVTVDLTATDAVIKKGTPFELRASVKNGGQPVTDGTSVTFRAGTPSIPPSQCGGSPGLLFENDLSEIIKTTSGGIASATLRVASCVQDTDNFSFTALGVAGSGRDELTITFGGSATQPQLTSVVPSYGLWSGGYNATLTGQNLEGGQVTFIIGAPVNASKDAQSVSWTADGTQLKILVPAAADSQIAADAVADLKITTPRGSNTFLGRFTYQREIGPTPTPIPAIPQVTSVSPSQGSWLGGERVEIRGANLQNGNASFLVLGETKQAQTVTWTPDGSTLVVLTPRASTFALEQDTVADIIVTTPVGASAPLLRGFTYLAADLIPEIYVISPTSGPISGGTRVTITGKGFQNPVQVLFGDRQAQVVSVNYNEVITTSPSLSPSEPGTPTTLNVTVTNVRNGSTSNGVPFRYGEAMFISSISPNEGPADVETLVTIFGQGFESPVRVMVGTYEAQVVSVAGTQIVARFPALPDSARSCGPRALAVEVTNINSNIKATGPDFFYRAQDVLLTSVTVAPTLAGAPPNYVRQYLPVSSVVTPCTTTWNSYTVTLNGSGFQTSGTTPAMYVRFASGAEYPATFVNPNQLTVTLPDLDSVSMQTSSCLLNTGNTGARNLDTQVPVTVINKRNNCDDTLQGALVIRPCDTECRLAFPLNLVLSGFGSVSVTLGTTSPSNCDSPSCSYSVLNGTDVILSAVPEPPEAGETNVLLSWSCTGDADGICDLNYPVGGPAPSLTCGPFTMSQQTQCTVQFGPEPT